MKFKKQQPPRIRSLLLALSGAVLLPSILTACGGDNASPSAANTSGTPSSSIIRGTAATGSALANANVAITDSGGNSPCVENPITTTSLGDYTCTLKSGETAPFVVIVTDPSGNSRPLVSVTTTTPAPGTPLTVNATPLTTAIVAQLLPAGSNPTAIASNISAINAATLQTITANVVSQLAATLSSLGISGYDPFSSTITAATASSSGSTTDQLLDIVQVSQGGSGAWQLSVGGTSVAVGDTSSQLPAASSDLVSLTQSVQKLAGSLMSCFALPASQRGTATSATPATAVNAIADVGNLATACKGFYDAGYLHNGYSFSQGFYGMLTSDALTGVTFPVPEITAVYPANNNKPERAVVNIKYTDANGYPGNKFTQLQYDATAQTWAMTGNQNAVDTDVSGFIRRTQQFNPNVSANSSRLSAFQSGIHISINAKGPGSVDGSGNQLAYAVVTGPGLPTNGLAFVKPPADQTAQTNMDISIDNPISLTPITNALVSNSDAPRCGSGTTRTANSVTYNNSYDCPNFWIFRTQGITGSAATTVGANPVPVAPASNTPAYGDGLTAASNGQGGQINSNWAQPGDGSDVTKIVKGAVYTMTLYYCSGSNCSAPPTSVTITKSMLADEVQATQAVNLPWDQSGPQTTALLDPQGSLNGAQSTFNVDWIPNSGAEGMNWVQASLTGGAYTRNVSVPSGATSVSVNMASVSTLSSLPALTTSSWRAVQMGYHTLDNSSKSSVFSFN